ncbi:protein FAF-like, chloroplastic [Senna tora]|uniref:Protein FAF-like, chloroplastic n=1 Tax=Senna tora TaxID=362788 RepID=A0A834SK43_9FABA|nr:protein FAF-like, chloroplastic [Senna tora]
MATCRSLQHIFENPLPEKPTLLESLSLGQIKPIKSVDQNSFTEIFGELHFKESPEIYPASSSSSFSSSLDLIPQKDILRTPQTINHTSCLKSRESLQLCTEGLGFESSDDVEELKNEVNESWETQREKVGMRKDIPSGNSNGEYCRKEWEAMGLLQVLQEQWEISAETTTTLELL